MEESTESRERGLTGGETRGGLANLLLISTAEVPTNEGTSLRSELKGGCLDELFPPLFPVLAAYLTRNAHVGIC